MYYVNENIANTSRIFPNQGREKFLRLDMNENPEGLPDEIVAKIREAITPSFLARYPEQGVFKEKYAKLVGVEPCQLCVTNGSDNAIRYILQTFAKPGSEVVTVAPTFEMYMVNCWLLGLTHKPIPYGEKMKVDANLILDGITVDTDVVALVNPNNPIGDVYEEGDVRSIIEKAAECGAMVVVDEAYHYFTKNTQIKLVSEYENLIVLRTFSKCLSLAGVRLGVAISNPVVARYLNNLRVSFEVNTVALKCGEIVLDTPGLIEHLADIQVEGRDYAIGELRARGYEVLQSESNFISFKPKRDAVLVADRLMSEKSILVKTFGGGPLEGWIRINSGSEKIMAQFIDALVEVDCE